MNAAGQPTSGMVPLRNMKPVLLVRRSDFNEDEFTAAKPFFDIITQRTEIPPHRKVIGRYSVLPFYKELCVDIRNQRGRLINNSLQHGYIADLKNWVEDLKEMTPETWFRLEDVTDNAFPIILKGATNSRKDRWMSHMWAHDRDTAVQTLLNLQEDGLTGNQPIYCRKYVDLFRYFRDPISHVPITKEFRFFVAFGKVLAGGFYWQNHAEDVIEKFGALPDPMEVPEAFLNEAIARIGDKANFYAIDIAQKKDGSWIVVELNDGQMSGTSCVDLKKLYGELATVVNDREFTLWPK
jgi:hypothetical protein